MRAAGSNEGAVSRREVSRRTVVVTGAWALPTIALAVAAPAAAASGELTLAAVPPALSAYIGDETFDSVRVSTSDGSTGSVLLSLTGTTFGDGESTSVRELGQTGSLDVSDIDVPAAASTGTLTVTLVSDPTVKVVVALTTSERSAGYDFDSLVADQDLAFTSVLATFVITDQTVAAGAQLTIDYDPTSLTLHDVQTNPQAMPSSTTPAPGAVITLDEAVLPGTFVVTFYFGRVSGVAGTVTVTTDFGETPSSGPTQRSVVTS